MRNITKELKKFVGSPAGIIVLFTVGVAIWAVIEGLLYSPNFAVLGKLVGVFALLGAFLGIIYATDPSGGIAVKARPLLRTLVSGMVGAIIAVVLHLSLFALVICVAGFTLLGWLGMKWARYVDF